MSTNTQKLDVVSVAFGLSASVVILFNTLLAIAKEVYHPLNIFMGNLSGNHWATHGILDVLLFFILGLVFSRMNFIAKVQDTQLIKLLCSSITVAIAGLILWFAFF
jgi:hypothetical protein